MQRTKKANAKAESNPVKTPETMLTTMTLEVILDGSGVAGGVVDKCFTVLRRQLALVAVLEVEAKKKKSKSRERVLLYLFLLLLLCSIKRFEQTNLRKLKLFKGLKR